MTWEYIEGSEADFEGAPDWCTHLMFCSNEKPPVDDGESRCWTSGILKGEHWEAIEDNELTGLISRPEQWHHIAERRKVDNVNDANLQQAMQSDNKYNRTCKGVTIDVYDVLQAFNVTNPALQHLIKKALAAGERGHKDRVEDLQDILASAKRAIELES